MKTLLPLLALVLEARATASPPAIATAPAAAQEGVPEAMAEGNRIAGSSVVPLSDASIERLRHAGVRQ